MEIHEDDDQHQEITPPESIPTPPPADTDDEQETDGEQETGDDVPMDFMSMAPDEPDPALEEPAYPLFEGKDTFLAWVADVVAQGKAEAGALLDPDIIGQAATIMAESAEWWTTLTQGIKSVPGGGLINWKRTVQEEVKRRQRAVWQTRVTSPEMITKGRMDVPGYLTEIREFADAYGLEVIEHPTVIHELGSMTNSHRPHVQAFLEQLESVPGWTKSWHKKWQERIQRRAKELIAMFKSEGSADDSKGPPPSRVGAIWPAASDPDAPLPGEYLYDAQGVYETGEGWERLIAGPCYVSRWFTDITSKEVRAEVAYLNDGKWLTMLAEPAALLDGHKMTDLANKGIQLLQLGKGTAYLNAAYFIMHRTTHSVPSTTLAGFHAIQDRTVLVTPGGVWGQQEDETPIQYEDTSGITFLTALHPVLNASSTEEIAREVWNHVWHAAAPDTMSLMIGWFWASLWADVLRPAWQGFPILNLFATRGTGKTTLIRAIYSALWGGCEVGSALSKPFVLVRDLSASTTIPVILDEFRPGEGEYQEAMLYSILRRAYDGSIEQRGMANQHVRSYPLLAPVILSGEGRPHDAALLDRLVMVTLAKEETAKDPTARTHMEWLQSHPDEVQQAAGWLLTQRLAIQWEKAEVRSDLTQMERYLMGQQAEDPLPDRALKGLAIVMWGLRWGLELGLVPRDITPPNWAQVLKMGIDQRRMDSPADLFIKFLEECWSAGGQMKQGVVPISVNRTKKEVRIAKAPVQAAWDLWCRDHNLPRLGAQTLEIELMAQKHLVTAINKVAEVQHKVHRCYILDIDAIKSRYGIEPEFWIEQS